MGPIFFNLKYTLPNKSSLPEAYTIPCFPFIHNGITGLIPCGSTYSTNVKGEKEYIF